MQAAPPPLSIRRVSLAGALEDDSAALALATQAWPISERTGQLAALGALVQAGQADQLILLAATSGQRLCGAVLAQVLAGRSAVVWPPQLAGDQGFAADLPLLAELERQLAATEVCLAQAVLDDLSGPGALALQAAGFVHAGDLAYMAAEAASFPTAPPPLDFALVSAAATDRERFARVVEQTYRGSLDCPLVDGLRPTADVLAGYRAVGVHRPEWWLLACNHAAGGDHRDVGCLLLADHPGEEQVEIVYLGIVPVCRGRGFGLALTRHAQWLARAAGRARVVLAVDAANHPALAAYESAGFVTWDRRSILIRDFRRAAKPAAAST